MKGPAVDRPWLGLYPAGEPSDVAMPAASGLHDFLRWRAESPRQPFLIYGDRILDVGEVDDMAGALATAFQRRGVAPGDRIGILSQNVPQFVVAVLAGWRCGAIIVPLNPMYKGVELRKILLDSGCKVVVTLDSCASVLAEASSGTDLNAVIVAGALEYGGFPEAVDLLGDPVRADFDDIIKTHVGEHPLVDLDPSSAAYLVYTSGSTGPPKGAMITHANVAFTTEAYRRWVTVDHTDVVMAAAPLFHVTGIMGHIGVAIRGRCPLVLGYRFEVARYAALIAKHRASFMIGATTAFVAMLRDEAAAPFDLTSLRKVWTGGSPMPASVLEGWEAKNGAYIRSMFGLTETSGPSHGVPPHLRAPIDEASGVPAAGVPIFNTWSGILDDDGDLLPPGEVGEIVIRGPQVVDGYWNQAEETAAAFTTLGLRTGDVGMMDEAGWLYVVDRKKDQINASGFKVWPREVEDVLYEHPAVREAVVVGVPDEYRGESVKAFVSLRPGSTVESADLIAFCAARLAAYKYPRTVEFVDELPRTATGKLSRRAVRSQQQEF